MPLHPRCRENGVSSPQSAKVQDKPTACGRIRSRKVGSQSADTLYSFPPGSAKAGFCRPLCTLLSSRRPCPKLPLLCAACWSLHSSGMVLKCWGLRIRNENSSATAVVRPAHSQSGHVSFLPRPGPAGKADAHSHGLLLLTAPLLLVYGSASSSLLVVASLRTERMSGSQHPHWSAFIGKQAPPAAVPCGRDVHTPSRQPRSPEPQLQLLSSGSFQRLMCGFLSHCLVTCPV